MLVTIVDCLEGILYSNNSTSPLDSFAALLSPNQTMDSGTAPERPWSDDEARMERYPAELLSNSSATDSSRVKLRANDTRTAG